MKQTRLKNSFTEEEKRRMAEIEPFFRSLRVDKRQDEDCLARLCIAIITKAVLDVLSEPVKVRVVSRRNLYLQEREEKFRRGALEFLRSSECEGYANAIRVLGRNPPNLKFIYRKCAELASKGVYFTTDQLDALMAQESSDAGTVEVPLSSDRLAA